ncbi:MAG: 23S rRNA (adenine(2503)-C(2))-methyltransferase RlmN [Chloroflexota bacterium]|nr:MAG: 23S rRNA (adenine(2503)-C(2))-methyltransferase RlmN [Chloroflexota bacterium]
MENLFDLTFEDIERYISELDEPPFRADQIWQGLYCKGWNQIDDFTPLPKSLRDSISQRFVLGELKLEKELWSEDGLTRKYLYRLSDGAAIETVLMSYTKRQTVCISSQVGCAMGCSFCATGNMGFSRNLTRGEIIEQVLKTSALLVAEKKSLTNVVLMGMGEPFHNYETMMSAIRVLNDPYGFNLGMRRFTISTVGLVPEIKRFAEEQTQINLALSLHAADNQLRSKIVPINKKYPLDVLMAACDVYLDKTKRRLTIEWALIEGVNDGPAQARKLAQLLAGKLYHVNLIQLNPVKHYSGLPSHQESAARFQHILNQAGISCTVRVRRGIDIQAGCGQLASESRH